MGYDHLTGDFSSAFQALDHTYQLCMQRILAKYGLFPGQPQILFAIKRFAEPTQKDLATYLSISRASAGMSLRRLENAGFVKRVRDSADSRRIRVALTKKGEDFSRWCEIDFEMLFSTMLQEFDSDESLSLLSYISRMDASLCELRARLES